MLLGCDWCSRRCFLLEKYEYSQEELSFLESSPIPFAIYQFIDKRVAVIALSKGFFELSGYESMGKEAAYSLMNSNMYRDTHPDDLAAIGNAGLKFATEGGIYDMIYRFKRNDQYRIIHAYGNHILKEGGVRLAFVCYTDMGPYEEGGMASGDERSDMYKRFLSDRSYSMRAGHDYLTGLPSMTYFFELAEVGCHQMRSAGVKPVILFLDFNGLKAYNQKYGLREGDRFIKNFSEQIIRIFSHENCSRFTADHFCVYTSEEKAKAGADELIAANERNKTEMNMPLRIGIYPYEDDSISISGACDRAKIACDSGKNTYVSRIYHFDPRMMTDLEHRQYVVKNIDKAKKQMETIGFTFEELIIDNDRNIYLAFGEMCGYKVELVAPINSGTPVDTFLDKIGPTPYHICYKSNEIEADIERLQQRRFKVTIPLAPAVAFGGKRVVFLYSLSIGLIEIVEE